MREIKEGNRENVCIFNYLIETKINNFNFFRDKYFFILNL